LSARRWRWVGGEYGVLGDVVVWWKQVCRLMTWSWTVLRDEGVFLFGWADELCTCTSMLFDFLYFTFLL